MNPEARALYEEMMAELDATPTPSGLTKHGFLDSYRARRKALAAQRAKARKARTERQPRATPLPKERSSYPRSLPEEREIRRWMPAFAKLVQVGALWECWPFMGRRSSFGHGIFIMGRRPIAAHRFSILASSGWFNPKLVVRHKCDNPTCVNPGHLEVGTPKDNVHDMIKRGRAAFQRPGWIPPASRRASRKAG